MRNLILAILLLSSFIFGGCALVSPFKPVNSCADVKNGGANCALISENLEYSITQDNKQQPEAAHSDTDVEKAELVRHLTENKVTGESGKRPVMLPPASYRVYITPYTDGARFYSGRYIYITSGKPRWVSGNRVIAGDNYISLDLPEQNVKKPTQAEQISNITLKRPTPKKETRIVKHRVSAYLLNCREEPFMESTAIAVFEQDRILDITDKTYDWWKVNFHDLECYVNSKYLYAEPEL